MDSFTSSQERLAFLMRVTERVCLNLLSTDYRLFRDFSILEDLQKIELDLFLPSAWMHLFLDSEDFKTPLATNYCQPC